MNRNARVLPVLLASTVLAQAAMAEIRLPGIFSDHMVLQAGQEVKVWGTAAPNDELTVKISGVQATTKADAKGRFSAKLPPLKATGEPTELTVTNAAAEQVKVQDVLVGQVWLGSGQSNMGMSIERSADAKEIIAAADVPQIRLYTVPRKTSTQPVDDNAGKWVLCSPNTVPGFSAVLYYFGRTLHEDLHEPVGLIHSSWGGTPIQAWTPREGFGQTQMVAERDKVQQVYGTPPATTAASTRPAAKPSLAHFMPAQLYNGMIAPVAGYGLRGFVWYQGENNVHQGDAPNYAERFKTMVTLWRSAWGDEALPFYFAQLPPYGGYRAKSPDALPVMWEQQARIARDVPGTGMAPTADVGDVKDIHPKNKAPVGQRLAAIALAETYGKANVPHQGPVYANHKVEGSRVRVHFSGAEAGLGTRDGKAPNFFEVAGADGKFVPAQAEVDGSDVLVGSDAVPAPTAVRMGWSPTAEVNLQNKDGWPAVQFRAGKP
jgi:sialate O-acetylesterase